MCIRDRTNDMKEGFGYNGEEPDVLSSVYLRANFYIQNLIKSNKLIEFEV